MSSASLTFIKKGLQMKLRYLLLILCASASITSFAQPVWSPQKRSEMEMEWMRDSLHLTPAQQQKASPVSLRFQQQLDNAHGSSKKEQAAMKKKDAAMRSIFTSAQYKKYYRREKQIRALPKPDRRAY